MIPEGLLLHTVTVVTPAAGAVDRNNETLDYGPAATRTDISARLQQDQHRETFDDGRTPAEQLWTLFTNTGGLLDRRARVEWADRGLTFEVHGDPEPAYGGAGFHHVEATLRIVEG